MNKWIKVIRADALEDYEKRQQEKKKEKGLKNALESYKKAWNYYEKYYNGKQAPKELEDYLMTDTDVWSRTDGARSLTEIYLDKNLPLNSKMWKIIKDNNGLIHPEFLSTDRLLEVSKYITDADTALEAALKLKKKGIEIPANIKKLMTKAFSFRRHLKDFEDIGYDNDSFMKNLEYNHYIAKIHIREHGVEGLSEKAVLGAISDMFFSELIECYLKGTLGKKYNEALIKSISKKIGLRTRADSELLNLVEKFGENLPQEILNSILKNKDVLRDLFSGWRVDNMKFPKAIEDAIVKDILETEDVTNLYYFLRNTKNVDPRLLNHYMQDVKKATKLYYQVLRAGLKAPKELVDMIASSGRLSFKLYEKAKSYNLKLDKEILDSANAYIKKKMDKE